MKTNSLSVYIGRGTVIVEEGGLIDTKNEKNKHFLEKRQARPIIEKQTTASNKVFTTPTELNTVNTESQIDSKNVLPSYSESERKLKYLDTIKRKSEIQLLQIKEEKLKGEVVPSALIQPVLLQHNQSIITEFKNASDEFIRIFSHKKSMTGEEMAQVKGEFIKVINGAVVRATEMSIRSVDSIIKNFAETRAQGERK